MDIRNCAAPIDRERINHPDLPAIVAGRMSLDRLADWRLARCGSPQKNWGGVAGGIHRHRQKKIA